MNPKHIKIVALVLVLLAGWRLSKMFQPTPPPQEAFLHYEALAVGAAEQIAGLLGGAGDVLLVVPAGEEPFFKRQIQVFEKEATRLGLAVEAVLRPTPGDFHNERGWSAAFYAKVSAEHPGAKGIVSFAYAPPISVALGKAPRQSPAKFLAVLPDPTSLGLYFQAGLVDGAILPNPAVQGDGPGTKASAKVWFNAYYQSIGAPEGQALPLPEGDQHMEHLTDEERDSDSPF